MAAPRKETNMRKHLNPAAPAILCIAVITSGCTLRLSNGQASLPMPSPLPTRAVDSTMAAPTPIPTASTSPTPTPVFTATPTSLPDFCDDPRPKVLIDNFKSALQTSDESLFASLVSPDHGVEVRLFRNGPVFNYDQQHARLLFDSTDRIDWGTSPSGWETKGSFNDVVVPALLKTFNKDYMLDCNRVEIGGAKYMAIWPYAGVNFYSVYYPGAPANNFLDWRTWMIGMEYVDGKPYLYAIMQFFWEP
jgi:hypothetical protein